MQAKLASLRRSATVRLVEPLNGSTGGSGRALSTVPSDTILCKTQSRPVPFTDLLGGRGRRYGGTALFRALEEQMAPPWGGLGPGSPDGVPGGRTSFNMPSPRSQTVTVVRDQSQLEFFDISNGGGGQQLQACNRRRSARAWPLDSIRIWRLGSTGAGRIPRRLKINWSRPRGLGPRRNYFLPMGNGGTCPRFTQVRLARTAIACSRTVTSDHGGLRTDQNRPCHGSVPSLLDSGWAGIGPG